MAGAKFLGQYEITACKQLFLGKIWGFNPRENNDWGNAGSRYGHARTKTLKGKAKCG